MAKSKPTNILNVIFDKIDNDNPIIDSDEGMYYIPYYKDLEYFQNYDSYVNFIKQVEATVRRHPFYSKYIKYLIEVVGINTCQVLSNISTDYKNVTIEMHHGPILTLFDTVSIVLNSLIADQCKTITTSKVANIVIEEHRLNNVRVVLLSKTVHQQVHDDKIILNYNQGFGDTDTFLKKYSNGIDKLMADKINSYISWCHENDSYDNDVFKISETMKVWGNNNLNDFYDL